MIENQQEESIDFLIEGLWILENNSGICIFEENYVDFTREGITTDLISSFLSAILTFADQTFIDEIKHIQFSNRRIVFESSEYVLFVIILGESSHIKDIQIKSLIKDISRSFYEKFDSILKNWKGNVRIFESFSEVLKQIVKKEPIKLKFLQFFDFKIYVKKMRKHFKKKKEKIENLINKMKKLYYTKRKIKNNLNTKN